MSAGFAGRLSAHLGLNSAGFNRGIQQAVGQSRGLSSAFAAVRGRLLPVTAALATVAAAAASIIVPAMRGAREIDEIAKAARRVDGSFAGWSAARMAAEESGVAVSTMADQVQNLNARLSRPNPATTNALRQLGLSADNLRRMDVDQRLGAIADRVQDLGLDAGQTTMLLRDLGIENRQMASLIAAGGGALAAARRDIEDYGLALSSIETARIEQANDRIGRLSLITRYLGQELAQGLVPWLGRFAQAMTESLRTGGVLRGILDGLATGVRVVTNFIGSAVSIGASFVQWLGEMAAAGIRGNSVLSGFVQRIRDVGSVMIAPIRFIYRMVTGFADLIRGAGGFGEAMRLLGEVAMGVWEGMVGSARAVPAGLRMTWAQLSLDFLRMVRSLRIQWGGFLRDMAGSLRDSGLNIGGVFDGVADRLTSAADRSIAGAQGMALAVSTAMAEARNAQNEYADQTEAAWSRARAAMEALREAIARGGADTAAAAQAQRDLNAALAETESAGGRAANGIQRAADAGRDLQNQMSRGADAIMGLIPAAQEGSRGALRYILQLIQQIMMAQLRLSLLGSAGGSGLAGWLGRLLSPTVPSFATGTRSFGGGLAAINERGGEIVRLPKGADVIPHDISKRMVGGMSGGSNITVNVAGANGDQHIIALVEQGVTQGLRTYDRVLPSRVQQIQANPRRNG